MGIRSHASAPSAGRQSLAICLVLVAAYMAAELVGGIVFGSLALLADAGHMLGDAGALALALFASYIAERSPTPQKSYGYHRTEILAALVNGVALVVIALQVAVEAIRRIAQPAAVAGSGMAVIAAGGLAVNLLSLVILHRSEGRGLGVRSAMVHVFGDALGSIGALIAAGLIAAFGWYRADGIASLVIALLILISAWSILSEAVEILMEGAPRGIDVAEVRAALREVTGVAEVHDLHLWTISVGIVAISAHVVADGSRPERELLADLRAQLAARFTIDHATIQIEPVGFPEDSVHA